MKKRGYFFMMDAVMAMTVLVLGVMIILSSYQFLPSTKQTTYLSSDLANVFINTKVEEINDYYYPYLAELKNDSNITNYKNTLMEQIGEFYYRNKSENCGFCMELATNFTKELAQGLIPKQYGFELIVENESIYKRGTSESKERARMLIASRSMVFGLKNRTTTFGPYETGVQIWQS